jgi:hypothetical protein
VLTGLRRRTRGADDRGSHQSDDREREADKHDRDGEREDGLEVE